ncbi:hypothetical protein NP493_414g02015 [Ridgeia piscesae]|uniref:Uncharacterized protein n=1 Tax=Ridgeia piscesae TaxID=27915 RepID=A0AAD9L0Z9_RIDPI|nr:hypothetical protein NP493_414g02015 [Ridgeia piscesae]
MKLGVIFFKEICLYRIFIGFTKMPCYQNVCYQDVLLPKCLLPKCPITEMSVTKTSITKVSFTEMSGYRTNMANYHILTLYIDHLIKDIEHITKYSTL